MNRAYSVLEIKAVDEDARIITGIATTPAADRQDDIVEPKGAKFKLPIPFLWQHRPDAPIGTVTHATVTDKGIEVTVQLAKVNEPGVLKDRLDEAWQSIKAGLVRGLSIGFSSIKSANIAGSFGRRFSEWEWLELSAVTVAANAQASIQTIKTIDRESRAALGHSDVPVVHIAVPAGASAPTIKNIEVPKPQEGHMNIAEQIKSFQAAREAKALRMTEIMEKAGAEGRTLDAAESEEFETLEGEVTATVAHLKRLEVMQKSNIAAATPVGDASGMQNRIQGFHATVKAAPVLPKGTAFTRYVIAQCRAKGNLVQAAEIAKQWSDSTPEVAEVLKAAMAAGTTTDADWAAPLVPYQQMSSEFIELLRPETIVGKLTKLRSVPFNVRIPGQTQGSSVNWVGEAAPKPVSELKFGDITLRFNKLAGIVVISDELARLSTPAAEGIIRGDLTAQIAQFMDDSFINPANAEVADVRPASVTNGVAAIVASGTDAEALRADVRTLYSQFIAANLSVADGAWVMTSTQAMAIGMMQNPLGQAEFPGLSATGGTFMGLPVVVSETVPTTAGTGGAAATSIIVLVKQSEILIADDGGVTIDVSREASLQMSSTPDSPQAATSVMTSLWQNNLVGIRAERMITWRKRRPQAVGYISGANYGG
jgi:HK97 family phage major capsid protein/HK97 family phage prohead protease